MILLKEHIVCNASENVRFLNYAIDNFIDDFNSNKAIKKAILKGCLKLNYKAVETGRYVYNGDVIQFYDEEITPPKIYNFKLDIIYEDEFFAIINKPAGIVVSGNKYRTVVNALAYNIGISKEKDALKWAKPVHRLDMPTSGLLIVSKTLKAHINLGKQFENKEIKKKYIAIVIGNLKNSGVISYEIDNKYAKTEYTVIKRVKSLKNKYLSLVELYPSTGRTHQLRIHLSKLGYPILGDKLYGKEGMILKHKGLFLSSVELWLKHPVKGFDMNIKINTPSKFITRLNNEDRRWNTTQTINV